MQITDSQLNKFIELYQKEFGVLLDQKSAYQKGLRVLQMMKAIYKPITKNDYEKYRTEIHES